MSLERFTVTEDAAGGVWIDDTVTGRMFCASGGSDEGRAEVDAVGVREFIAHTNAVVSGLMSAIELLT